MAPKEAPPADEITPAPDRATAPRTGLRDKATEFLEAHGGGDTSFTPAEEKAVLCRIRLPPAPAAPRRLLLPAARQEFLEARSVLSVKPLSPASEFQPHLLPTEFPPPSYVSIFGISQDANLVGKQFSWLGSILYLAQLVMQPLAAFLLVKLPTGKVIAGAIFPWGSALAVMSACTDFPSLLGLRFVLGAFETLIAPSCVRRHPDVVAPRRADAAHELLERHERRHGDRGEPCSRSGWAIPRAGSCSSIRSSSCSAGC
ncbi:hypothetical protein VTK26DRAFT_3585 [Humicola hyalothermophila]